MIHCIPVNGLWIAPVYNLFGFVYKTSHEPRSLSHWKKYKITICLAFLCNYDVVKPPTEMAAWQVVHISFRSSMLWGFELTHSVHHVQFLPCPCWGCIVSGAVLRLWDIACDGLKNVSIFPWPCISPDSISAYFAVKNLKYTMFSFWGSSNLQLHIDKLS